MQSENVVLLHFSRDYLHGILADDSQKLDSVRIKLRTSLEIRGFLHERCAACPHHIWR
jgi:hypothetical protein